MLLENYNVVVVTETWWDDNHDWSVAIDGYKLFRGTGKEGGMGVLLSTPENE